VAGDHRRSDGHTVGLGVDLVGELAGVRRFHQSFLVDFADGGAVAGQMVLHGYRNDLPARLGGQP